ncbi:MAG TPA: hypothetical protein VN238_10110 [Solirubrobacteraceae bacterium]|nr:hypothetical protein [Solirubrobacteraceae bacterium]
MLSRKLGGLAAAIVATAAVALGAAPASAFQNVYVGTPIDFVQQTGAFAVGPISCTGASLDGPVTVDNYPALGGTIAPSPNALFSGCTVFGGAGTVTTLTSWNIVFNAAGATVSGVSLRANWGSLSCTYGGTLSGPYDDATGEWDISSTLTRTAGATLCPVSATVTETFLVLTPHALPVIR